MHLEPSIEKPSSPQHACMYDGQPHTAFKVFQIFCWSCVLVPASGFVLSGYFQGKRNAEHAMAEAYPEQGVCLRPGFIHGTRYVSGVGIPLSFIGETDRCTQPFTVSNLHWFRQLLLSEP